MQPNELLNQRQPDARAFVRPRPATLGPIEALEEMRNLLGGDPGAGIADRQLHGFAGASQRDRDLPVERELERVRQEIEDDLLPHVAIDVDGSPQRGTLHHEAEPGTVHRRPEVAGEIGRQGGQIRRLVARLDPPGLDTRKIEQRVDQLEQSQAVPMRRLETLAVLRVQRPMSVPEGILDRRQHQGERRPELVADVAEERRLGPIDLRQGLGPPALFLVGTGAGDGGGDLGRGQLEESAVAVVELDARAHADHQQRRDSTRDAGGNRQHQRLTRRIRPWPPGHAREAAAEIVDDLSPAGGQRLGERPAVGVSGLEGNDWGANDSATSPPAGHRPASRAVRVSPSTR